MNVSYLSGDQTKKESWDVDGLYYSLAGLQIKLESRYDKYIFIYYIPTTMFTLTSWVSFLLPPTSYPARTTLLVTVFLCQIGIFNAVIKDTPNKDGGRFMTPSIIIYLEFPGLTALECWCLACIALVFQALISYVIILARIGSRLNYKGSKVGEMKHKRSTHVRERGDLVLEWILFSWVLGSAFVFNIYYWTKQRSAI